MNKDEERAEETLTKKLANLGEEVLINVETRSKDRDRYEGPYKVVQKVHERQYVLQDESGKTIQRNVEKMKQFFK